MMLFHHLARQPVVRAIARRLIPSRVSQSIATHILPSPTPDHFRLMLSETADLDAVPGRVVIVCGSLQPGGAERQAANTLVGLSAAPAIEQIIFLCDYLHGGSKEKYDFFLPLVQQSRATTRLIEKQSGTNHISRLPAGFRRTNHFLNPGLAYDIANLYWEFRAIRPSVVHAWLDWSNVRAGLAAVLAGVPRVLLSGRNLNPSHFALNVDYYHPVYSALAERDADQVVFLNNSQAGADDYAAWLSMPPERIRVVRNGVLFENTMRPMPAHCAAFRARLGIPADAPLVGGMFRFNEEKRPLLWLQVAARVAQALPDAHFVVFGRGDMRDLMQDTIRELGIETRCHLYGTITPSFDGLAPCDLILLTSRGEGIPNVLLEAQWLGVPVVTTDAGGAAEAVNDGVTGRVVLSDDEAAIADAVLDSLKDEKFRTTVRTEGPAFIAATYGLERMINEILAVYNLDKVNAGS